MNAKFLDLVVGGPDMSGTSTQVQNIIEYFQGKGMRVKDIRGTEVDALFHAKRFEYLGSQLHCRDFINNLFISQNLKRQFLEEAHQLMSGIGCGTNQDLRVSSAIKNNVCTYIDQNSADVWIMEEPTKRSAGQVNRVIEQNRSQFNSHINPTAAAETHSVYRTDEFLRFRKPFREKGKIIIRSRSEESACYQIYDKKCLPNGVREKYYLNLAGHKVAFGNPPTHIFVVCGPKNWTAQDYLELKRKRCADRYEDDHEKDASYQVLVNKRYASSWLNNLYKKGCKKHGGQVPEITRFDIYASINEIRNQMNEKLEEILNS